MALRLPSLPVLAARLSLRTQLVLIELASGLRGRIRFSKASRLDHYRKELLAQTEI